MSGTQRRFLPILLGTLLASVIAWTVGFGQSPNRTAVPDKAALAKAADLIRDVFGEDLQQATAPAARVKIAATLLQQGKEAKDDPALRYALYHTARDLAANAGDVSLALQAADEIARTYEVDPIAVKTAALSPAVAAVVDKEAARELVDVIVPLIQEAIDADNYPAAFALGQLAEAAARKTQSPALVLDVQRRNEQTNVIAQNFRRVSEYVGRLAKDPQDAAANLELGKYYGFHKRRWDKALPLLARGSDKRLSALADADQKGPTEPKEQIALADRWWELGRDDRDPTRLALQARAAHWYEKAIGQLSGLTRTKAQKRIEAVHDRLAGLSPGPHTGPVGELKRLDGHGDEVKGVTLSPDGRHAASGSLDQTVRLWDIVAGKEVKVLRGHTKQVWGVLFHPNARQVFSVSWDATARLWDVATGAEVRRFTHGKDVNGLALSRDAGQLVTGCDDQNVYLWNANTGEELRRYTGHSNYVYAVALAPDGRHVASGSVDKTVRVHDLQTGQTVRVFEGHTNAVTNVAFSADSRFVLSAGDAVIHVWDLAAGKEARTIGGSAGQLPAMALSPDGRRLLTGGDDRTVRLWDVATGKELHRFSGHTDTVTCVAFSPDGRRAISGSAQGDKSIRVWGLPGR
jgi:hypothetical protein